MHDYEVELREGLTVPCLADFMRIKMAAPKNTGIYFKVFS